MQKKSLRARQLSLAQGETRVLLDENIPRELLKVFKKRGLGARTVQAAGWSGIKNGDLAQKVLAENFVLVTRDKDFSFLWKKHRIKVVYMGVEPSTLQYLRPELENCLDKWKYGIDKPFLIMIQRGIVRN